LPGASLEALTGRLGVGAIAFLGLFLIVDGFQVGAFEMIELYGKSATWGIVGVVPTAVVIYIVGVFCVGLAEMILAPFPRLRRPAVEDLMVVSQSAATLAQQSYAEQVRNHELLKGAAVSFVILALGSLVDSSNLFGFEPLAWIGVIGSVALSVLSLVFSQRAVAQAHSLANAVRACESRPRNGAA